MKYCPSCGRQNEDQAAFCTGCGNKFPDQAGPSQGFETPLSAQQSAVLTVERVAGIHEHMLTDLLIEDSTGKIVLAARLQSLLHEDYNVVDGDGAVVGTIQHKTHLTHRTLSFVDENHTVPQSVSVSLAHPRGVLPNCWLEDASGNKQGWAMFTNGLMGFSVELNGTVAFQASLVSGGEAFEMLKSLEHRKYALANIDPGLPMPLLLTTMLAIEQYVTY